MLNNILEQNGVIFFIDYNEIIPYEKMAKLAISSLKVNNPNVSCCVIYCNDYGKKIQKELEKVADYLIEIPQVVNTFGKQKKISNFYQIYYFSPYKNSLYFDCSFLFFNDINYYFSLLENKSVVVSNKFKNFRGNTITKKSANVFFDNLELRFVNCETLLFTKNDNALEFFNLLSQVSNNWEFFYGNFLKQKIIEQDRYIDLSLTLKLSDNYNFICNDFCDYIDISPRKINYTDDKNYDFYKHVNLWLLDSKKVKFNNYILSYPIHYDNYKFLDDEFLVNIKNLVKNA
jgi:hypothetical protein